MTSSKFGRLESATMTLGVSAGGASRTLAYAYDAAGNRTRITHPDGVAFGYSHDPLNRLSQLSYHNAADGANGSAPDQNSPNPEHSVGMQQ